MAQNLFPTGYESETSTVSEIAKKTPVGFRNGVAFDYLAGDFPRDGRRRLMDSTGIESWKSWVINCMATARYKYLAYSPSFGIEIEKVFAATSRSEAESILTRQITDAMRADPYGRTQYIESIAYDWNSPEAVEVTAVLHGLEDVTIDVTAYITRGGA